MDGFKAGEVRKLDFEVPAARYKDDLDDEILPPVLYQKYQESDKRLSSISGDPDVRVEVEGERWIVPADDAKVVIVAAGNKLHFYEQKWKNSMAEAIEKEFEDAWKAVKGKELPMSGKEDRRILYVAVARGVLGYLREHAADGFKVDVEAEQKEHPRVVSSGKTDREDVGSSASHSDDFEHRHNVEITQIDGNTIVCSDEDGKVILDVKDVNNTDVNND